MTRSRARHCGGRRLTRSGEIVVVYGGKCRSDRGLCGCPCAACRRSAGCKHERTYLSAGSIVPMGVRVEPVGRIRSVREDGTPYVGPGVRAAADPEPSPAQHWSAETCLDCGMTLRSRGRR